MYSYIKGVLVEAGLNSVVVENNGIGYELGVSGNTLADARIGSEMKLYTYLYVREDTFALYGFSRLEEKTLFMRLIEISGIGPKLAMQILSGYDLRLQLICRTRRRKSAGLWTPTFRTRYSRLCHSAFPTPKRSKRCRPRQRRQAEWKTSLLPRSNS